MCYHAAFLQIKSLNIEDLSVKVLVNAHLCMQLILLLKILL